MIPVTAYHLAIALETAATRADQGAAHVTTPISRCLRLLHDLYARKMQPHEAAWLIEAAEAIEALMPKRPTKITNRTAKSENPGDGGRGSTRRRMGTPRGSFERIGTPIGSFDEIADAAGKITLKRKKKHQPLPQAIAASKRKRFKGSKVIRAMAAR